MKKAMVWILTWVAILSFVACVWSPAYAAKPPVDNGTSNPDYKRIGWTWGQTIDIWINPRFSGLPAKTVVTAILAAINAWDSKTGYQVFRYRGLTPIYRRPGSQPDGYNVIGFGWMINHTNWPAATFQHTSISSGNGSSVIYEADIILNTYGFHWSVTGEKTKYDVQSAVTHELGHVIGLADLPPEKDYWLTMYAYQNAGQTYKRTLGLGDVLGLQSIYGP